MICGAGYLLDLDLSLCPVSTVALSGKNMTTLVETCQQNRKHSSELLTTLKHNK